MSQINSATALVTGASTGIGAAYADRLARRGHSLILVARDEARLNGEAAKLRGKYGVAVEVIRSDLTFPASRAVVEQRLLNDPSIGIFVNNAGMAASGSLIEADPAGIEELINLNVIAATRLAAAAARAFAARRQGTIINIASVLAVIPERFNAVYNASKAFVLSLTQSMQQELGPVGVRVQAVLPGATRTEIWARSGIDLSALPAEMVMAVDEMVDAALAGLDQGEDVTIPALPDIADWQAFQRARLAMVPNLSRDHAAARYGVKLS